MMDESVDVVIVGSGAGGAPVALELARAGAKVLVLEKGRALNPEEMIHDEISVCRRNMFVPYVRDEPHTLRVGHNAKAERTAEGWTANVVGGATVHFSGYFFRMHPVDMRLRSTLGAIKGTTVADWPITYDDLEPYYARVEREIGVSGRARSHPFEEPRSTEYPLPPLAEDAIAKRIDEAAARLGYHTFPTPRAILSEPYRGRPACGYCSLCGSYACEMGAKSSMAVSLLPAAVSTGRCEIRPRSMAVEVSVRPDGLASGVVYVDATQQRRSVGARCVVLACSALETARLLLMSRSALFPSGLANNNGLVGRNLLFSGMGKGQALFRRKRLSPPIGRFPFVQRAMQDFYFNDDAVDGVRKGGTILFDWAHANPINTAEQIARADAAGELLWGKALKDKLRSDVAGAWRLQFEVFAEYLPTNGTYADLDPDVKDHWGLPVARMTEEARHPHDRLCTSMLVARGMEVLRELGPDDVGESEARGTTRFLQGGTCRFGTDPGSSVLDPSCRAHEVPNLYVTDGSFLPSSGGVPITLTILANAFRVAGQIATRLQSHEL
jgi:choline dehydrogenase-like flavoprotein